jgi:hypothetical protein
MRQEAGFWEMQMYAPFLQNWNIDYGFVRFERRKSAAASPTK